MRYGASSVDVKRMNRNRVFRYLNSKEKACMPGIAADLNMSAPTVLQIVRELEEAAVIQKVGEFESTGGRKAKAISTVWDIRYAVGIDITKNHIGLVLTDLSKKVLKHTRIRRAFEYEDRYFKDLGKLLEGFIEGDEKIKERLAGVGIAIPGIVDSLNGYITHSGVFGLYNIACEEFSRYIPYPCILLNDASAAAATEYTRFTKAESTVYLSLSNTVGGSIIFRQDLEDNLEYHRNVFEDMYVGCNWHSGEFGHMVIHPDGKTCYCGKMGCADPYCSALRLAEVCDSNLELFFSKMLDGKENEKVSARFEEYLDDLAILVDNLRMCFDCDIVLGGYVGSYMGPYIRKLQNRLQEKDIFESDGKYVRACRYQLEASALGAALYHIETFINSI